MSITLTALQKQRRDTAANWTTANPTLLAGEIGLESDTGYWKVGDGSTAWTSLAYVSGLGAEIPVSRLADGSARQLLQTAANGTDVEWTSNIDVPGTLDVTGAATFDNNVIIQGDLTVNGTETIINTQTLDVEDKNIVIGKVTTPSDVTADGGGITLKGTTDKTISWIDATDAWTSSEHVNIASGKEYRINGTKVLDATSLGSGVVSSSLTSVGTIGTGIWNGTTIGTGYGGTGQTTYTDGQLLIGKTDGTLAKATLTAGSNVTITNGNGSITIASAAISDGDKGDITVSGSGGTWTIDSGTVTSAKIADGTIVDGDINASAAIAGTKISPDFGSQTVTTTGVISAAGGTASAPSITFTGDLNTGIYSPGADQVAISTAGSGRLFVDASGRVGVGTTSPASLLTSYAGNVSTLGAKASTGLLIENNGSVGNISQIGLGYTFSSTNHPISIAAVTTSGAGSTRADLVFATRDLTTDVAPTERLRIDSSGRVGIGTSSVAVPLHISSSANGTPATSGTTQTHGSFRIASSGTSGCIDFGPNGINPWIQATDRTDLSQNYNLLLNPNGGRVGIGTTSPQYKLHVSQTGSAVCFGESGSVATVIGTNAAGTGSQELSLRGFPLTFTGNGGGGSEAARIDSSGRLLVGTSSSRDSGNINQPYIQREGTNVSTSTLAIVRNSNDSGPSVVALSKSRGTSVGSSTVVQNGDALGAIYFSGADGSSLNSVGAWIQAEVDGTPGTSDMPGRLVFSTTADGASSPTERFRINNAGSFSAVIPSGSTLYPSFFCRAWVNFDGTGTPSIRANGNVSSIADNGVGDYTVNFTTAMPDANYSTQISIWNTQNGGTSDTYDGLRALVGQVKGASGIATGSVGVQATITATDQSQGARGDMSGVFVAVFR